MIHTIQNSQLQLSVKQVGAEICSIKSVVTGREFIWDANPEVWANHAPVLFPIVGALKDETYQYNGQEYSLPQHGFMRHNRNIELFEKTENSLSFVLRSNDATKMVYPFEFEFITKYELQGCKIIVSHEIRNNANDEMYFSVGAHPAFKCPLNDNETYSDYYLEFEETEQSKSWQIVKGGLIGTGTFEVFNNSNIIQLHPTIFNNGALVFKDLKSKKISLKSIKSKQIVSISYEGFSYMGIWAKPQAEFVCIEPWLGIADSVNSNQDITAKEGVIKLKGGEIFKASYLIEIEE